MKNKQKISALIQRKYQRLFSVIAFVSFVLFIILGFGESARAQVCEANNNCYYVAPEGNDSNDGSFNSPWASPQKAWYTADAGDIVYFRGGTYYVTSVIYTKYNGNNGNAENPITFKNYPDESVTIEDNLAGSMFEIQKNYNYIEGIHFIGHNFGANTRIFRLAEDVSADYFKIENCTLEITSSTTGDQMSAIHLSPLSNHAIIRDCIFIGPNKGQGVQIFRTPTYTIENNEIRNYDNGIMHKHSNALEDTGLIVRNNYIHSCNNGIRSVSNYATIENNLIVDCGMLFGDDGGMGDGYVGADYNTIRHNTIYNGAIILRYETREEDPNKGCLHNVIKDNIFMTKNSWHPYHDINADIQSNYNLYVAGDIVIENSINYILSAWQTQNGGDANSLSGTPTFVGGASPSTISDFALADGSPGKNVASDGKDMGADVSLVGINAGSSDCGNTICDAGECNTCPSDCSFADCCPDGNCNNGETHGTCPSDCLCTESWTCTSWSDCIGGQQTRTCIDQNDCGTTNDKPIETQSCGTGANECVNWQTTHPEWIFCDDFENSDPLIGEGRYFEYDNNGGDFVPLDGYGFDNSKGMRTIWQTSEVGAGGMKLGFGRNPSGGMDQGIRNTEDFRDIYYRMYVKMQNGWQGNPNKLSRATVISASDWSQAMIAHLWGSSTIDYLDVDPVRCVDESNNVKCVGYNDFANMDWLGLQSGITPLFDSSHDNQWFCIEAHVKLNDAGQSNGIQEFWIDDQFEARRDNLNFVRSYTDYAINAIFFENHWNSGSPQEQERYFDNIVVSTQRIGSATEDSTPPSRSNPQPTGTLSSGTTSTTISLDTDETATCKYSETAGTDYDSIPNTFSSTNAASHSQTISNLSDGETKTYYIRCQDESNNQNTDDFEISFDIASSTTYSISNFINLVTDWLKSESGLTSDVNGDGVVNTRDLGIMMSNWQ